MHKRLVVFFMLVLSLLPAGCSFHCRPEESVSLKAVSTIFPVSDILANLGGAHIKVTTLLPPGASPHTYEPQMEQVKAISAADLFVYVGAGLDNWALKLADAAPSPIVIELSALINREGNERPPGEAPFAPGPDPHFWLDPLLVRDLICPRLTAELITLLPEKEELIRYNLTAYQDKLTALDREISAATAACRRREFISMHSAWKYFARRYNLEEVAVVSTSPGQEPSAGRVTTVINAAVANHIQAILVEPQLPVRLAARIAEESGCRVLIADPLGGEELPGRESYLELMRYNLDIFEQALK